ncbi:MAG: hypothetical protein FWF08_05220 [Oscillospiraceae bacterium]|nr:hypothetical protein [Oscillospiraceae bacterium]
MEITENARKIYDKLAVGWNTWDVRSVTSHIFLPDRLRLNLNFFITHLSAVAKDHAWENVECFGEHAADGSYTDVTIRLQGAKCRVETASRGRELVMRVTPAETKPNYFVSLSVEPIWGGKHTIGYRDGGIIAGDGGSRHFIRRLTEAAKPGWNPVSAHQLIGSANGPVYYTANSGLDIAEADAFIEEQKNIWLNAAVSADGDMGEALAAMRRSLLWNTVYDSKNGRIVSPVSRNWCRHNTAFGDYVVFGWDTFFAGLQMGLIDKDLAYANIFSILEEITPEGMLPNFGAANGSSRDRSEPQVGSLCVWKLYIQYGDVWFVEECYDRLLEWNRWRFRCRDKNSDGLLELASDPWEYGPGDELHGYGNKNTGGRQGAMWESGIDNSPMFDRAIFNEEKHCLELSYAGLNALMAMDCKLLAKMARLLGKKDDETELTERAERLSRLINEELWDEKTGCYMNRHWTGEFDPCLSLTHFYPLTAGIVQPERMDRLVNGHLLNPDEFWGEYVIPNVSRSDPAFNDQDYWRGRIWAPTNFIVAEGLRHAGLKEAGSELAKKGLDMFLRCWREKGVVGENYNGITGEAAERGSSDRFYHWGALLAYLALEERICFNPWTDSIEKNPDKSQIGEIYRVPTRDGEKIDV